MFGKILTRIKNYLSRLLFPLYLFPIKLATYTLYYLLKALFKALIWPFHSWKNFFKTIFWAGLFAYFAFTEYRFFILTDQYGGYQKFFCLDFSTENKLKKSVVRIVGGDSEGSGFFISNNQVLTNFHVVDGEPSPKVILPDGTFYTPEKITAYSDADLALLTIKEDAGQGLTFTFLEPLELTDNEPVIAAGYPLGTDLAGEVSLTKGNFGTFRYPKGSPVGYIQSSISLVPGMSGGPLVDQCGKVIGVNTMTLSGLSLFIASDSIKTLWPAFTDQEITQIEVDPSASPQAAVEAYYTYLKARRMENGFNLLSQKYLEKTNFQEWTSRFPDILDVQVYQTELVPGSPDTVFIKFSTKNWVGGEVEYHYYEGTWQTIQEDDVYKMLRSNIKEVFNPDYFWFFE